MQFTDYRMMSIAGSKSNHDNFVPESVFIRVHPWLMRLRCVHVSSLAIKLASICAIRVTAVLLFFLWAVLPVEARFTFARHYDPTSSRFLSPDPAGFAGSTWDLYNFANNDANNQFDPDGRFGKEVHHQAQGYLNRGNIGMDFGQQWHHQVALRSFWEGNHNTQRDMYLTRNAGYFQGGNGSWGSMFSGGLDMVPIAGGVKSWVEHGFTGRDLVTGERINSGGNQVLLGVGIAAAFIPGGSQARAGGTLLRTEARAALQTEFAFAKGNLSGRLTSWNAAKRVNPFELAPTHPITKSRGEFAKLKADIAKNGVKEPISYIEHNGQKYILDGHHRARAAKELGLKDVPIQEVQLPFKGYNTIDDVLKGGW